MGERITYMCDSLSPLELKAIEIAQEEHFRQETDLRRQEIVAQITESRDILDLGIVPSKDEKDDFYAQLGDAVEQVDLQGAWENPTVLSGVMALQEFYESRGYTFDWVPALTPELRRAVMIDGGKAIADRWRAERESSEQDG